MKNKFISIFSIAIVLMIVIFSFAEVVNDYMPYYIDYYKIEKNCPGNDELCKPFKNRAEVLEYLENKNPHKRFDAITLSTYVIETSSTFGLVVFLLPLIVIINVVFRIHDEISSGFIKNKLSRMSYSKLLREYFLKAMKVSLIIPLIYIFIFGISCLITNFNFNITENMQLFSEYETFKYSNFFIYSVLLIIIQYLLFFGYSIIGIFMSFINKSKIVSVIFGYIYFVILCIFYLVFGTAVIKNLLGINYGEVNYFNLIGNYWSFNDLASPVLLLMVVLSVVVFNVLITLKLAGSKEKGILWYERQRT